MDENNFYVDVHTHILPGVDDGSQDMEETVRMLKLASEQEIRTIIATPHYIAGRDNTPASQLEAIRDQVQAQADQWNINIYLGNELYYSESILEALKAKEALTLADSRYVLVEFSVRDTYERIFKGLKELVYGGYAPILAHVERYQALYKRADLISELVKLGCYIQMNAESLLGGIFNSEANSNRKLFNLGLVHLIGSDCHDSRVRTPRMKDTVKTLRKKCDEGLINMVFMENPMNVLKNTYI